MKNYELAVGIDVSKKTLDVFIHNYNKHRVFDNCRSGYDSLLKWVSKFSKIEKSVLYCFEHTGNYSLKLAIFMQTNGLNYVQENPIVIKRSSGLVRTKTDRVDAQMIARYAWLHREELVCSSIRDEALLELGRLLSLRDQLVRNRTGLMGTLEELSGLLSSPSTDVSCKSLKHTIAYLSKQILKLEKQIDELVKREDRMSKNYKLLTSLKGVGRILACQLIYHTCNFERFSDWRQFSSYCGTAPFQYSSGTSVYRRSKGHPMSDRKMKTLLNMASISAIQHDGELRSYYQRKVEEGKPKMLALNNVRNKLISRAFAVIKRGTPYVDLCKYAA
ncbi:IS110 family transposase [Christiangramia fulva]|uniref:IS110 family transposase n=1 Tax=Christiangramia fulva TaxID=2126553 RepID=A0A2R3Z9Z2_9FLAO|nr:IS110 family transposase [Christiangramia fulva]AVR47096.1 IS110 family transposase [Christiangramia fulva]